MPIHFIRKLTSASHSDKSEAILGTILAFIAGAINAGGFLAVGIYTSHMSGIASSFGDYLALHKPLIALLSLAFLSAFICGAAISSIIINFARNKKLSSEFALPLMLEAVLLLIFGLCADSKHLLNPMDVNITILLLCFIMGLQNAIITKISDARIRTTHVTGISTDIGIEMGRFICQRFANLNSAPFHPQKIKLHSLLLAAFLIGGVYGAFSFKYHGFITILPLVLILAILASVPILDDLLKITKKEE